MSTLREPLLPTVACVVGKEQTVQQRTNPASPHGEKNNPDVSSGALSQEPSASLGPSQVSWGSTKTCAFRACRSTVELVVTSYNLTVGFCATKPTLRIEVILPPAASPHPSRSYVSLQQEENVTTSFWSHNFRFSPLPLKIVPCAPCVLFATLSSPMRPENDLHTTGAREEIANTEC